MASVDDLGPGTSPEQSVSVVMIVRDGEDHLAEAIESALAQTHPPVETVVVDDGSTDATADVARRYAEVDLVQQPPSGIGVARNRGVRAARGRFVAFLDHDDTWHAPKLERQLDFTADLRGPFVCTTLMERRLDPGGVHANLMVTKDRKSGLGPSALLAPATVFDTVGPFDEHLEIGVDSDWFARARDLRIPWLEVPEVLVTKRLHQTNMSARAGQNAQEMLTLARRSLARKRAADP